MFILHLYLRFVLVLVMLPVLFSKGQYWHLRVQELTVSLHGLSLGVLDGGSFARTKMSRRLLGFLYAVTTLFSARFLLVDERVRMSQFRCTMLLSIGCLGTKSVTSTSWSSDFSSVDFGCSKVWRSVQRVRSKADWIVFSGYPLRKKWCEIIPLCLMKSSVWLHIHRSHKNWLDGRLFLQWGGCADL